jgi:hypothetical protein
MPVPLTCDAGCMYEKPDYLLWLHHGLDIQDYFLVLLRRLAMVLDVSHRWVGLALVADWQPQARVG